MKPHNAPARGARPRALYRAVLSLAVAAVIAAAIPFAAIYVGTLNRAPAVAALGPALSSGGRHVRLITTASGRRIAVPTAGSAAVAAGSTPLTTRTSSDSAD